VTLGVGTTRVPRFSRRFTRAPRLHRTMPSSGEDAGEEESLERGTCGRVGYFREKVPYISLPCIIRPSNLPLSLFFHSLSYLSTMATTPPATPLDCLRQDVQGRWNCDFDPYHRRSAGCRAFSTPIVGDFLYPRTECPLIRGFSIRKRWPTLTSIST